MLDFISNEGVQTMIPVLKTPYAFILLLTLVTGALLTIVLHLIQICCEPDSIARKKRCILVTGCDSGFGKAIAESLNDEGHHVFATCLTKEGVQYFKSNSNFNGSAFIVDVTKEEDIKNAYQLVQNIMPKNEGLWGLVNNAGVLLPGPIEWQSTTEMRKAMDVNLWGAVNMTKAFLPMIKKARGRVVNITSIAGRMPFPHAVSYSMSKFALEAFTDELRLEMRPWGVSVHTIEPGMFKTNILNSTTIEDSWSKVWEYQPKAIKEAYGEDYFRNGQKAMAQDLVNIFASTNITKVINSVENALFASSPSARYVIGYDANLLWVWVARLPTMLSDLLLGAVASCPIPDSMKHQIKSAE